MLKKFIISTVIFLVLVSLFPLFLYWWGLSNIDTSLQPSQVKLTSEQELSIWLEAKEEGAPSIKAINVYEYIAHLYCTSKHGLYHQKCMSKCPGLQISALAVRDQVAKEVHGQGNTVWVITWIAYSIWVTNNWDTHQILATYHDVYNT